MWTLLIGSALQCLALVLFLPANGLWSLYVVSALFGLFQGGIVPSYAIVVREYFSPKEAGARVGTVLMFTLFGMALGGWMSGKIFDLTGSYDAAFVHGIAWNVAEHRDRDVSDAARRAAAGGVRQASGGDVVTGVLRISTHNSCWTIADASR